MPVRDSLQPLEIGEQQVRALVRRHAPRETEDRELGVERDPAKRMHLLDQPLFGLHVRVPHGAIGDAAVGAYELLGFVAPAWEIMVVQLTEALGGPGGRVHAVRYSVHTVAG